LSSNRAFVISGWRKCRCRADLPSPGLPGILPGEWRPQDFQGRAPGRTRMRRLWTGLGAVCLGLIVSAPGWAEEPRPAKAAVADYFAPPESKGGWRSLLPEKGEPGADQKAVIAKRTGVDWDKLKEAWDFNAGADGASGLLVIRKGYVVGEWYRGGDR